MKALNMDQRDSIIGNVYRKLMEIESRLLPCGLHVVGCPPTAEEAIATLVRNNVMLAGWGWKGRLGRSGKGGSFEGGTCLRLPLCGLHTLGCHCHAARHIVQGRHATNPTPGSFPVASQS